MADLTMLGIGSTSMSTVALHPSLHQPRTRFSPAASMSNLRSKSNSSLPLYTSSPTKQRKGPPSPLDLPTSPEEERNSSAPASDSSCSEDESASELSSTSSSPHRRRRKGSNMRRRDSSTATSLEEEEGFPTPCASKNVRQNSQGTEVSQCSTPTTHTGWGMNMNADTRTARPQRFTRHRPTRSRSAPPERSHFEIPDRRPHEHAPTYPTSSHSPHSYSDTHRRSPRRHDSDGTSSVASSTHTAAFEGGEFGFDIRSRKRQIGAMGIAEGYRQFGPSRHDVSNPFAYGSTTRGGELLKPPPPLHRPTTFWRRTTRSGVTASSYSPSSHVIRRATFIAAGLEFDHPVHDLSAMGVESRIRLDARQPVKESFWEVVEGRN